MSLARVLVRCIFYVAMLTAAAAPAHAHEPGDLESRVPETCRKWPQNRLVVGSSLKSRHFMLEAAGPIQRVPANLEAGWRKIYHRTFNLSLDVAEPVALYSTNADKTCVIAEDNEKSLPVRVPVFFAGRAGQSSGELKADAERTAFAPSASLDGGVDFAKVTFRLRRGGSSFNDIRPFFVCGLAGVMLCEGYCPGDTLTLARLLVDWAVTTAPRPQEPAPPSAAPEARGPETSPPGAEAPKPSAPAPGPGAPRVAEASKPEAPASPQAPAAENPLPLPPAKPAQAPQPHETPAPVQPEAPKTVQAPSAEEVPPPANPGASKAPEAPVAAETKPPPPPEVPKAPEPPVPPEIQPPSQPEAPKAAEPPAAAGTQPPAGPEAAPPQPSAAAEEAPPAAGHPEAQPTVPSPATRRLLLTFRRSSGDAISPAEILGAEGSIRIEGQALRAAPDGLATELPAAAFARANTPEALQKLFPHFRVLEVNVEEGRTIITAEPIVSPKAGSILIELLSADSDLSNELGTGTAEGFWSSALDLASQVSQGPWERKLLARAQYPGVSAETRILEDSWGGKLAVGPAREAILRTLIQGSRADPDSNGMAGWKPVERVQLDLALDPIRRDAGIEAGNGRQEALLFIAGGVDPGGGYFCHHPIRPESSPWARPGWVSRARRIFVLEIWSEGTAQALQRISRAKAAGGAPEGIYLCNVPGADGANIALYGILPQTLSESARPATFAYLAAQASNYLKP